MSIHESQLANLRTIGYTEVEARFLYLVATHSRYFTVRQFLDFARARSGKRNARLVEKLFGLGHASARRYRRRSMVYHLHSRPLYDAIGKGDLRIAGGTNSDTSKPGSWHSITSLLTRSTTISRRRKPNASTSCGDSAFPRVCFSPPENMARASLSPTDSRSALRILLPTTCLWSPSHTSIPSTETWVRTSLTCAHTGLYSGNFRVSNFSTFRRKGAYRKRRLSFFCSTWKARACGI